MSQGARTERPRLGSPGSALRSRVLAAIMAVTVLAVLLFALPLALAVQRLYRSEAVTALERDATGAAAVVPDSINGGPFKLPPVMSSHASVGVYDTAGRRIAGSGPGRSALAASGGRAQVRDTVEGEDLAVIVPIPSDQQVAGTVRAAVPYSTVTGRVQRTWAAMTLLVVVAVGLAAILARQQAIRLATPLERLTAVARALGDGDFTVRAERFGVREADAASQALEDTATRLGRLLERERAFSADVSHQLRTPLTALTIGLESALDRPDADLRGALDDALTRSEHLRVTIEDLLSLTRRPDSPPQALELDRLTDGIRARWHAPLAAENRRLVILTEPDLPPCPASSAAVRQILDVLVSNALHHGSGTVTVDVHDAGAVVAIDVSDEGSGFTTAPDGLLTGPADRVDGHGHGLPLAHSLALAAGGRLVLRRATPQPIFSLLLPATAAEVREDQQAVPGS